MAFRSQHPFPFTVYYVYLRNIPTIRTFSTSSQSKPYAASELLDRLRLYHSDKTRKAEAINSRDQIAQQIRSIHNTNTNTASEPTIITAELASHACSFMTQYHADQALSNTADSVNRHRQDVLLCWDWLQASANTADVTGNFVWKIEMATRLEDTDKLRKAFMELFDAHDRDFKTFSNDELMVAFSALPYISEWSLLLQLSDVLTTKVPNALVSLYNMAQTLPIPDLTMIYELVRDNKELMDKYKSFADENSFPAGHGAWTLHEIERVRVKLLDVECFVSMQEMQFDEKKRESIMNNVKEESKSWVDVSLKQQSVDDESTVGDKKVGLQQMGGIAQVQSFCRYGGMNPVQLYGPWMHDRIKLKGKVDVPIYSKQNDESSEKSFEEEKPGILVFHEEEWDLMQEPDEPKQFVGRYVVRQRNEIIDNENIQADNEQVANVSPMNWIYDMQVIMK